jgi:hypothetical protein
MRTARTFLTLAGAVAALGAGAAPAGFAAPPAVPVFSQPTTIDNPYLPLTAHRRCELRGRARERDARALRLVQPEGDVECKLYAPGVGALIEYETDGRLSLVGCR